MLTRTVADTAAILDVLAGYEPGDATWAPPPAEPFAASAARAPGRCGSPPPRSRRSPTRRSIRSARSAVADAAELLRSLGHEVEEVDPPWQDEGLRELFGVVFSSQIALSIAYSGSVAGREPTAEDMEPMSWAIFSMIQKTGRDRGLGATVRLQASRAGWWPSWRPTTRC